MQGPCGGSVPMAEQLVTIVTRLGFETGGNLIL
jgi:hypothetical protein